MSSICALKAVANLTIEERRVKARTDREQPDLSVAIAKLRNSYKKVNEARERRQLIFLTETPKIQEAQNETRCQARTLENKPCPFRATCGKYCKRHQI